MNRRELEVMVEKIVTRTMSRVVGKLVKEVLEKEIDGLAKEMARELDILNEKIERKNISSGRKVGRIGNYRDSVENYNNIDYDNNFKEGDTFRALDRNTVQNILKEGYDVGLEEDDVGFSNGITEAGYFNSLLSRKGNKTRR